MRELFTQPEKEIDFICILFLEYKVFTANKIKAAVFIIIVVVISPSATTPNPFNVHQCSRYSYEILIRLHDIICKKKSLPS